MITAMGSKSGSKALMEAAGVPLVPGYHGDAQDDTTLSKRGGQDRLSGADQRHRAGGGGRGMRVVRSADQLTAVHRQRQARGRWRLSAATRF